MIALVDYGAGNIHSVSKALEQCGGSVKITDRAADIGKAEKILLPGVGAFGQAMDALENLKLVEPLRDAVRENKPFLGICVGLQLLFESSEESPGVGGLALLEGRVKRFPAGVKIPHLGWNEVRLEKKSPLWDGVPDQRFFYYANSYFTDPEDASVIVGTTDYNVRFTSSVQRDNLFGCQFHPEKSQKWGLRILENFVHMS
ncbi:imidazole glycerol phosphate synthase subunit HisH [bacterium]|nr:imidazole glycerol phosphate synthase subunit HisH [bacterium]